MDESILKRLASIAKEHLNSTTGPQQSEEKVIPLDEAFPIPSQYNYCALGQYRGDDTIYMIVKSKGNPQQAMTYILKTGDMSHVRQLVEAAGFSPSWDDLGFANKRFSDHESDHYFYSR